VDGRLNGGPMSSVALSQNEHRALIAAPAASCGLTRDVAYEARKRPDDRAAPDVSETTSPGRFLNFFEFPLLSASP